MDHRPESPETSAAFPREDASSVPLRILACGGGPSTLIGRLAFDSDRSGAERARGAVDRTCRRFSTDRRHFIVVDVADEEPSNRAIVTAAANADLALLSVDARNGIDNQTRRLAYTVALLGVRHIVLAVDGADPASFDEARFGAIRDDFVEFSQKYIAAVATVIPVAAGSGDEAVGQSGLIHWYRGPTLLDYLETADRKPAKGGFRFPIEQIDQRSCTGVVAGGGIRCGDEVVVAHKGQRARIDRIVTPGGELTAAHTGDAVTLVLNGDVDADRGDILAPPDGNPEVSDQIAAHLIWMADDDLLPGRSYRLRCGPRTVGAMVSDLKHRVDVDTFKPLAAKTLARNDIGLCNLSLAEPLAFDLFDDNRITGSFELIDRFTDAVVAVGLIRFGLRRAANLHWQALDIDKRVRAEGLGQRPCVLWFTGLSGAGKSTVANLVEKKLHLMGFHTYLLDGDNVRHGLNRDLGFTDADRVENIRRIAETAKLFVDAGLIVLVSFISPFRLERDMARDLVDKDEFLEVHVDAPLEVAEARDPKGLYKKARAGDIKNFTGIDSPYEPPPSPDIYLDTTVTSAEQSAERIIARLRDSGYLGKR